jgi:hypothetical protein
MKLNKRVNIAASKSARNARLLADGVKAAIDDGELARAEIRLADARGLVAKPKTPAEQEVALTLRLERATIMQYRGRFSLACKLAEEAIGFADECFGPRGIQIGRARLRHNFALEGTRRFERALKSNLELDDELVTTADSGALRLNCLTRAIACAVKNADRSHLSKIGMRSEPIRESLDESAHSGVVRWHLFWCAVASLRQGRVEDAETLLDYAGVLAPVTWRWSNAAKFVKAHGLMLQEPTSARGQYILNSARADAEKRGFHGLVRSIDAGLSSSDFDSEL